MYYIEVHLRINQLIKALHQCFVWRNEEEQATLVRKIAPKLFYLIFQIFFAISMVSGGLVSIDTSESVFLIACGTACIVAAVKVFYLILGKEQMFPLIQEIGSHSISDYEEFKKVNGKVNNLMKFSTTLYFLVITNCAALSIFSLPVFSNVRKLPFNIWFPLNWKNNVIFYCIVYTFVVISITISLIASALNGIIWYLMLNGAMKYQIIGNQFRNMFESRPTNRKRKISKVEEEKLFLQDFIGLIKAHKNIEETIDRFKSCFKNLFFLQITTSAICICCSVYALAFGEYYGNVVQALLYVTVMLYNFFDIFMVMYLGNEIMLCSDRLSYCLFESNWLDRSESCKKCLVIFTEALKQPQVLVIGILYPLNLETFTSIINLAYSMFNILQNFN